MLLFTTPACGDLVPCILSGLSNNSAIVVTCKPSHNAKLNISHLLLLHTHTAAQKFGISNIYVF